MRGWNLPYQIKLTKGKYTIVDADTYEWASKLKWYASNWKTGFYATRRKGKNNTSLHREIMQAPKGLMVDHINGDTLDNRKCNLRLCSNKENQRNQKLQLRSTSGYKGVHWHKCNDKWIVNIKVDGKLIHLGYFTDVIEGAKAYDKAALFYFGSFANINFPIT